VGLVKKLAQCLRATGEKLDATAQSHGSEANKCFRTAGEKVLPAGSQGMMTRRAMLAKLALGVAGVASAGISLRVPEAWSPPIRHLSPQDEAFLEDLSRANFQLFQETTHPKTGLVKDRVRLPDSRSNKISSIAATGFGLTALCVADERGWLKHSAALDRARKSLRFLWRGMPQEHGFFYHFVDWRTGAREWQSEVSSIDSAILLCGVLSCRQNFADDEIKELATKIYERMDWQWLFGDGPFLRHGWTPERGFLTARWDTYCEHMMLYLLAIGARQHAIPATAWNAWHRPVLNYGGYSYIETEAPLFIHQYSHAWFDFRRQRDGYADYFRNSALATHVHRRFCVELGDEFPHYSNELWGITASESPQGYVVWGGPPRHGPIDGSVVPCAAGGSLPFLPSDSLATLRGMRERFGQRVWGKYGFADAFNPATGWVARDRVAINTGITLLMAENTRTGFVWDLFMKNPEARNAMQLVGFRETGLV
jgi:hypothetical protein